MMIQTAEQRLAGVIGQIIVENARLGAEVDRLRAEIAQERARAERAEKLLNDQLIINDKLVNEPGTTDAVP